MLKGILTYISIIGLTAIWTLGWTSLCWLVGASMNIKASSSALLGALLGPLGLVAVLSLGTLEMRRSSGQPGTNNQNLVQSSNPFA